MAKLLVIGAGGIGSWLIARIARLRDYSQLGGLDGIVVADYDEVEKKNLPYQNFELDEIMDPKARALEIRYGIFCQEKRITEHQDLDPFDIIICAVDNSNTRKLVFEHCSNHPEKYFIDLRAEGTAVWAITSDAEWPLEKLIESLGTGNSEDRSCQRDYELEAGIIQLGNTIISEVGAQWLLNHVRNKKNPIVFSRLF